MGRNRTVQSCSIGRWTGHAPGLAAADHTRITDNRRRLQTTVCKTILAH